MHRKLWKRKKSLLHQKFSKLQFLVQLVTNFVKITTFSLQGTINFEMPRIHRVVSRTPSIVCEQNSKSSFDKNRAENNSDCDCRDFIMSAMASEITYILIVCSGTDQRRIQSSASQAFVGGIHRWPVDSPHKGPATLKIFPFDDVIMCSPQHTLIWEDIYKYRNLKLISLYLQYSDCKVKTT